MVRGVHGFGAFGASGMENEAIEPERDRLSSRAIIVPRQLNGADVRSTRYVAISRADLLKDSSLWEISPTTSRFP